MEITQETDSFNAWHQQLITLLVNSNNFSFIASTGRTATMYIASTLQKVPGVLAMHEGHKLDELHQAVLPPINIQNRKAWHDPEFAKQIVESHRSYATLSEVTNQSQLLLDVAYYNASILEPLIQLYPQGKFVVIFRRCESFVRSATINNGEDMQPAGWPDKSKSLSDREQFISIGRLKPAASTYEDKQWPLWTAIQRNVWLWCYVNTHLLGLTRLYENCHSVAYEQLSSKPLAFWQNILSALELNNEVNLDLCCTGSGKKINQRNSYQIGPVHSWNTQEKFYFEQMALPLEKEIYG